MDAPRLDQYTSLFTTQPVAGLQSVPLGEFLVAHPQVRFLRLQWQDHSGLLRTRLIAPQHLLALTEAQKPVHTPPIAFHCIVDNNLLPELDPTGSHYLIPDWSSLRPMPAQPQYATVMCGVLGTAPAHPQPNLDLCPRRALASVLHTAAERFGLQFQVGFEVEFEVMRPVSSTTANPDGYNKTELLPATSGLGRYAVAGLLDPHFPYIEEAVFELVDHGVNIQALQTEGRCGQYELSLGPRPPLEAVDELIVVHHTLKSMLGRHGLVATMASKPVAARRQATGQHTHISISDPAHEREFLAGMLHRLPALCALCMPYDLSYERVHPYLAGNRVAWGSENREVPIRKIRAGHWEVRCVDATANMYLALAATLASGLLGIEQQQPLWWPDTAYPKHLSVEDHGIQPNGVHTESELLPQNVRAAVELLEKESAQLGMMMNNNILDHYCRVKKFEASRMEQKDVAEARNLLNELF